MTVKDLLSMRSGFKWGKQGDQYDLFQMMMSHTYILEPNQFRILSFILKIKNEKEAIFKMNLVLDSDRNPNYKIGLDDIYRISEGRFGIPAAAKGYWGSDDKFTFRLNEIGNINCFRIDLIFHNGSVRFNIYDKTGLGSANINGKTHK